MQEKHWEAFRQMNSPLASYFSTALDDRGNVDNGLYDVPTARHIELGISFEQDLQRPPEMRILIRGGPAVSFMIAYIRKSRGEQWPRNEKRELENLRAILDSTVSMVAKELLGIRLSKGRPRDIGERAAYLLYHEKKPIYLVSQKLCASLQEPNHTCNSKCFENIKKAARNHFKHLRRELESLAKSS